MFFVGVSPGPSRFPLGGIAHDQFDMLTRSRCASNGFSCNRQFMSVLAGRIFQQRHGELLVVSCPLGGPQEREPARTALKPLRCACLAGMPRVYIWRSTSCMNTCTRWGMAFRSSDRRTAARLADGEAANNVRPPQEIGTQ